jgi:predicted RND superfamily exporter protein
MASPSRPSLWERWADFTIRHDRWILGAVLAVTVFFAFFLFRMEVSTNPKDFFRKESAEIRRKLERNFRQGDYVIVIFEAQGDRSLLEPELLRQQYRVIDAIKKKFKVDSLSLVEGIHEGLWRAKRKSLLDVDDYDTIAEGILALSGPRTVRDLERVSQNFLSHPGAISFYTKFRIAAGMAIGGGAGSSQATYSIPYIKAVQSFLQLEPVYSDAGRKEAALAMRDLAWSLETPDLKTYLISPDVEGHDIDVIAQRSAPLMGVLLLAANALLLWGIFRSRREVFLSLFVLVTACIWTFGGLSLLGLKLTFLHIMALPILLGTADDDGFVFGRRFAEERAKQKDFAGALRSTYAMTGQGIFLTTFTTFIAFFSSAWVTPSPGLYSFYLLVSLSMVVALVLTLSLQGALRSLFWRQSEPPPPEAAGRSAAGRFLIDRLPNAVCRAIGSFAEHLASVASKGIERRARLILAVSLFLFLAGLGSATQLKTQFDRWIFIRKAMPSYAAEVALHKYFGPNDAGHILIEGEVENPELLKKMRELEERMGHYPLIKRVLGKADVSSVNELIDKMKFALSPEMPVRSVLDEIVRSEATANFVLDETYREAAEHLVHKNNGAYDGLVMKFFLDGTDSRKVQKLCRDLLKEIEALGFHRIPGIRVRIGGGNLTWHLDQALYFRDLLESFFLSFFLNVLVLIVFWRRIGQTLLAAVPVLFAVACTIGLMPLFGVRLNILNLCVGAIVVGVGIDYSILFVERFNEEVRKSGAGGASAKERLLAAQRVLLSIGPSLFGSVLTTVVGFGSACLLAMPIAESFGLLTSVAILIAYLSSVFLLPVLLIGKWNIKNPSFR